MSLKTPNFIKRYALLTIAFICSLCIPFILYSIRGNPLYRSSSADSIQQQQQQQPYEYPAMVKYGYHWPEMTSFKASSSKKASSKSSYNNNHLTQQQQENIFREIDQKYCGQDRCKFILPVAITEQGKQIFNILYIHCLETSSL
jgi:hypothetical protein